MAYNTVYTKAMKSKATIRKTKEKKKAIILIKGIKAHFVLYILNAKNFYAIAKRKNI